MMPTPSTQRFTWAEIEAFQLLYGLHSASTEDRRTPHDAGNEIIRLAEQIKAERAVQAMEPA